MGVLVVPVNWHWVTDEVAYVLDNSGAKALLADAAFAEVAVGRRGGQPGAGPHRHRR